MRPTRWRWLRYTPSWRWPWRSADAGRGTDAAVGRASGKAPQWWGVPALALALAMALLLSGAMLLVVVPLLNAVLPRDAPFKGATSRRRRCPGTCTTACSTVVRLTVLPLLTLTPISTWFLRAMGMRIGPAGAHRHGVLHGRADDRARRRFGDQRQREPVCPFRRRRPPVIAPVLIGRRATIGEKATVMGDVIVGDDAVILAHSVLIPAPACLPANAGRRTGAPHSRRRVGGVQGAGARTAVALHEAGGGAHASEARPIGRASLAWVAATTWPSCRLRPS